MRLIRNKTLIGGLALLPVGGALGQAAPAATRSPIMAIFRVPTVRGSASFSVSASERLSYGYTGTGQSDTATVISGNLGFLSPSVTRPFSAIYSGGYLASTGTQPSAAFHDLALSQVIDTAKWNVTILDHVSYLPESATTGLAGLSGIGNIGLPTVTQQGVLTRYATRVDNRVSSTLGRKLTPSTLLQATGSYAVNRFLQTPNALESNLVSVVGGISHRIDARSAWNGSYDYGKFTYLGLPRSFTTQGLNVQYARELTRKLRMDFTAGPQWVNKYQLTGTGTGTGGSTSTGTKLNYTADLSLLYAGEHTAASINYARATNSGSGVTLGARTDTARANVTRQLSRNLAATGSVSYGRSNSLNSLLQAPLNNEAIIATAQVNRTIRTNMSAFLSYTLQRQSTAGVDITGLSYSGTSHIVGFGFTYAPPPKQFSNR